MEFLELTEVSINYPVAVPTLAVPTFGTGFSGYLGGSYYNQSVTNQTSTTSTSSILIRSDDIIVIKQAIGQPYNSLILLENNREYCILESHEMIKKQIHTLEFNKAMEKILE